VNLRLAVRNAAFTFLVPGTVAVLVPWLIVRQPQPRSDLLGWLGALLILAGVALYVWCLWNFATVGRGTPGPWDPPTKFVATGPYRWVRNPMYIALISVIIGEASLFGSVPLVLYAALIAFVVHSFVMLYEEPMLARQFGQGYRAYRAAVNRWIPRWPPDSSAD
jgi:protein-S-isoprenylcysteine O-methyltransferase Ste14